MRSIAQSLLARHPVVAAVGVGFRWVLWLIAGHPFGLMAYALAVVAGLPWWYRILVAIGAEVAVISWGVAGLTPGAQAMYLWAHLARFRRRWPAQFARSYPSHRWPPVVVDNHYSVPGGLRPALAAPRLSMLPRAFDRSTIGWRLLPLADHDSDGMAAAIERLGRADDRIARIELQEIRGGQLALIVGFRRPGRGRSSRLATGLDSLTDEVSAPSRLPGDSAAWLGELVGPGGASTYDEVLLSADDFAAEGGDTAPGRGTIRSPIDRTVVDVGGGGVRSRITSNRRTGFPMKWSFSVILPSNLLMALAVTAGDAGRVGIVAVFAAAVISIILIIAEGVSER